MNDPAVRVEEASSADDALAFVSAYDFDVVLIDRSVGDVNMPRLVESMRRASEAPIVIGGRQAIGEAFLRECLRRGADDVIVWPAEGETLRARVDALMRRRLPTVARMGEYGALRFRLDDRWFGLAHAGSVERLALSRRETDILEFLVLRAGTSVTLAGIAGYIWGGSDGGGPKAIQVHVCRIRRKALELGFDHLVETRWGRGYVLGEARPIAP